MYSSSERVGMTSSGASGLLHEYMRQGTSFTEVFSRTRRGRPPTSPQANPACPTDVGRGKGSQSLSG